MGFVSNLVGGALGLGGNKGGNFQAQAAPLLQGVNTQQTGAAYGQAQTGIEQQQAFLNALQAQNGIQNQQNVFGQQQALANQLQGLANGTGPNPALQQLQNTTGQNVANQAALMAGQRGASANAGLLARQAAMQGSNIQQQAAGQGAALSAQQQIAGMQALQQQQGMMGNLAGTQIGQQANALTGYNQAAQSEQNNLLSALGNYNQAQVGSTSSQNSANAGVQEQVGKNQGTLMGGLGNALSGAASIGSKMLFKADGGMVPGPQSFVGKHFKGMPQMAAGGPVMVPGKAAVQGDSLKNDTVHAMLSPGEIVIPRHVIQSKNPGEMAAKFVEAILAKKGMK